MLQANASVVSLLGIALGARADRRFLVLPAAVFGFFAQHALQGWCPPIPVFRRLGVRTRKEIERERHALKVLRGDFDALAETEKGNRRERVRAVLAAVDADAGSLPSGRQADVARRPARVDGARGSRR